MNRPYSSWGTFRTGRTVRIGDKSGSKCLSGFLIFLLALLAIAIPIGLVYWEQQYFLLIDAFHEMKGKIVPVSASAIPNHLSSGTPVYFSSQVTAASVTDPAFNVHLAAGLKLQRKTEYCQWTEVAFDKCQTCTRTVRSKDGGSSTESYSCNCVRQYNYIKKWQSYRINSLLFNQPGAHFNPQRDPFPSTSIASQNTQLSNLLLTPDLVQHIKGASRSVAWTPEGSRVPRWYDAAWKPLQSWIGWTDRTRYEPQVHLKNFHNSQALSEHNFVYVGDGYFFSPYVRSMHETMFKYFVEWMEGSLWDFQIGDLMRSCEAGDIRVHYDVTDPEEVSGIGSLQWMGSQASVGVHHSSKGMDVGVLHAGSFTMASLIDKEAWDAKAAAYAARVVFFVWSLTVAYALSVYAGSRQLETQTWLVAALALTGTGVSASWLYLLVVIKVNLGSSYLSVVSTMLLGVSAVMLAVMWRAMHVKADHKKGGWNAVWCWLARVTGAPPEWRVENTYGNPPPTFPCSADQ